MAQQPGLHAAFLDRSGHVQHRFDVATRSTGAQEHARSLVRVHLRSNAAEDGEVQPSVSKVSVETRTQQGHNLVRASADPTRGNFP